MKLKTSRISIGHALAQMPQAMHLEAVGASSTFTSTPNGHASLHLPQPTHPSKRWVLPKFFALSGVLYSMPVSDVLTFAVAAVLIAKTYRELGAPEAAE